MPKVSVCCSVKNQIQWLEEMIQSLQAQSLQDWELVLVDDGSDDDILGLVEKLNDSRIRFFAYEENQGIPHGINWAFREAKGDYIKPMAADETLWNEALAVQADYLNANPNIAACFGLPRNGPFGLRPEYEVHALDAHNRSRLQWLDTLLGLKNVPLGSCNALWRRSLFDELGHFAPNLKAFVDHEWYCRLVKAHDIKMLPYRVANYRDDPNSVGSTTTPEDAARQLEQVRAKHIVGVGHLDALVTVGIPVKNMPQYVLEAIKSVQAQTYPQWELLIVDDGSTDNTYEVIDSYLKANHDSRIKVIRFPENKGDRNACNYMVDMAKGEYFVALSADDVLDPTFLARAQEMLKRDPLLDFCASQTDFIDEHGKPFDGPHPFKDIEKASNKSQAEWKARLWYGNVYFGAGMYRTDVLRDVGGWRQEYGVISDYAMYLEMLARGNIHVIEEPLTHTRITGSNMSTKFDPLWLRKTYAEIKKRFYLPRRKLIIATPFYSVQGYSPYIYALVHTIKMLDTAGVDWEYWHPSGDAYVHRVKNTILSKFLEDPEATDLLMIDSDMEWDIMGLVRMLQMPEELIVGSYPQKNSWHLWTSKPKFVQDAGGRITATQKNLPDGGCLIEGEDLAGGFVLVKRGILERYAERYPELRYIDESADPAAPTRVYTEFFTAGPLADDNPTGIRRFWGEDRQFSRRLKEMGERWWIYTNIRFSHWGMKAWEGNFNDQLLKMRSAPANEGERAA